MRNMDVDSQARLTEHALREIISGRPLEMGELRVTVEQTWIDAARVRISIMSKDQKELTHIASATLAERGSLCVVGLQRAFNIEVRSP